MVVQEVMARVRRELHCSQFIRTAAPEPVKRESAVAFSGSRATGAGDPEVSQAAIRPAVDSTIVE